MFLNKTLTQLLVQEPKTP